MTTKIPTQLLMISLFWAAASAAPARRAAEVVPLPGTAPLRTEGDLTERAIDGAVAYMSKEVQRVAASRSAMWKPDYSSRQAYEASVEPNRTRFRAYIGLADSRVAIDDLQLVATVSQPALLAET